MVEKFSESQVSDFREAFHVFDKGKIKPYFQGYLQSY